MLFGERCDNVYAITPLPAVPLPATYTGERTRSSSDKVMRVILRNCSSWRSQLFTEGWENSGLGGFYPPAKTPVSTSFISYGPYKKTRALSPIGQSQNLYREK
eukprot:TRINITY_DN3632_c0_g2_i2.p1 TRINITY_DN3632_c0_g2~~TRINITY_DN3632_c0_g2_i2.p1  ORF type:complete len:103 (+),score=1.01 TRINITY_DN3632_c0_g2_i2:81-389(+)